MEAIFKALGAGFKPKQILDYVLKKFPNQGGKIKSAIAAGYTADQIMSYLTKGKYQTEPEPSKGGTLHEQTRSQDINKAEQRNSNALKGAALAAGAVAAPSAISALQRAIPSGLQDLIPGMLPASQDSSQLAGNSSINISPEKIQEIQASSKTPYVDNNLSSNEAINQTKQIINKPEYVTGLDMLGIRDKLERMRLQGKSHEIIKAAAKKMLSKEQMAEMEPGYFDNLITSFLDGEPTMQMIDKETRDVKPLYNEEESAPIEKGHTVITPNGIGKVLENRNGKTLVEVDGKKVQLDEDALESSNIPEKELADLYDDMIGGIEKETGEDISRMTSWAGYDPKKNELAFLPHDGGLYIYNNISPEDVEQLTSILNTRKTSGENFIGAWKAGSKSPIGAAMSALIRKLQGERGGKGNEYSGKFQTVYNYLEPALKAAKKRKKKK